LTVRSPLDATGRVLAPIDLSEPGQFDSRSTISGLHDLG
jgi:hypothetical protein